MSIVQFVDYGLAGIMMLVISLRVVQFLISFLERMLKAVLK